MRSQCSQRILMLRPRAFGYNPETAISNSFQNLENDLENKANSKAQAEFDHMVKLLRQADIRVDVFQDSQKPVKPDAVFPNNWCSFPGKAKMILYPMMAENRRLERDPILIESIQKTLRIKEVFDLSDYEKQSQYLEGTGSLVFDHPNRIAYACASPRTSLAVLNALCHYLNYQAHLFEAFDRQGKAIYHSNVLMNIGSEIAVICLEAIRDEMERKNIIDRLEQSDKAILEIDFHQMENFAGNMLELKRDSAKNLLVLSEKAFKALKPAQLKSLSKNLELLAIPIPTIERLGGGSVRCMMTEIF